MLNTPLNNLPGIGPRKEQILAKELGVKTFKDLLNIYPFRYIDKTQFTDIQSVKNDQDLVQFKGTISNFKEVKGKFKKRLVVQVFDKTGQIELLWFQNFKWIKESLIAGKEYVFFGRASKFGNKVSVVHPEFEKLDPSKPLKKGLEPVYHSTEKLNSNGLNQRKRKQMIAFILSKLTQNQIPEYFDKSLIEKLKLRSRFFALKNIHLPTSIADRDQAVKRLKFEELFFLQLRILYAKKYREKKIKGMAFNTVGKFFLNYFNYQIAFELTNAQKKVIKEIRKDLGSGLQMNRLLQGDVGSGKTIVALLSMLLAIDNGYQACLMAPTEILAQQHFESISEDLKGSGIYVGFLSGSVKGKTRKETLRLVQDGLIHILIGTHALLEDWVQFSKLGLAIIDEQHRFGVAQRAKLWAKSSESIPHILVMTATPIPRTMALTIYGDLDTSVIDELPPGRKAVHTVHQYDNKRPEVYHFIEREMEKGRQIYIVYPLIEESETLDLANLQQGYDKLLQRFPRPKYQISVVHGRMKPADKEAEMQRFVQKETQIMVATTVIEVGVNVPNASVMIIENAERFGLSQLHQLRGRVGRGAEQSYCILMSSYKLTNDSKERLGTMVRTNDGFEIAEVDLKLRGPGDLEGTQQSGVIDLKIASIIHDASIVEYARNLAASILNEDPHLQASQHLGLRQKLMQMNKGFKDWGRIS